MPDPLTAAEQMLLEALMAAFLAGWKTDRRPGLAADTRETADNDMLAVDAVAYASHRGGQLITDLDIATYEQVNATVERAVREGWTPERLQTELTDTNAGPFGRNRANMIARTEIALAYNQGEASQWARDGVEYVEILDGTGDPICAAASGAIWTLADYLDHPLGHPNCQRSAIPIDPDDAPSSIDRPHDAEQTRWAEVSTRPLIGNTFPSASRLAGGPPTPQEFAETF